MLCSSQSGIRKWAKPMLAFLMVSSSAVLWCQSLVAEPLVPSMPVATEWLGGPVNGHLGSVAEIKVPLGYKFTDAPGARAFLEGMAHPVPKHLLGILAPESGDWWVVLEFTDLGYVKADEKERVNPAEILKSLASQPQLAGVEWELKPQYDAAEHTLEWAVRAPSQPQPMVSHVVRMLGRRGSLDALILRPYRGFSDLAPLRQLVKGIAFKAGEGYADFQSGDKVSANGLAALITGYEHPSKLASVSIATKGPSVQAEARTPWIWVGAGVFVCVGLVVSVRLVKKPRGRKADLENSRRPASPVARPAAQPTPAAVAVEPVFKAAPPVPAKPVPAKPLPAMRGAEPASPPLRKAVNGKNHGGHRKRVFDYNRYFADLMSAVSSHTTQFETPAVNGYAVDNGRFIAPPPSPVASLAPAAVLSVNSEVIAHQQALIAEQKRLIQEQTKLIEEKTKLIAEKNQLLKLQSEYIEQKLL